MTVRARLAEVRCDGYLAAVPQPSLPLRVALSLAGAFAGGTFAWLVLGLVNTGDAFPQGPAKWLFLPLLVVGVGGGGYGGMRVRARQGVVAVIVLVLLALAFWVFAADGWWAVGPPAPLR